MNLQNPKKPGLYPADGRSEPSQPAPSSKGLPIPNGKVLPLFRRIDWLALAIAFAAVWIVYFFTLAPELTLEDSGELCTGTF